MIVFPRTLDDVAGHQGTVRAGGTDLQDRRRLGLARGPLTDLRDLHGVDGIVWQPDGSVAIGARATIATIAGDRAIQERYPGFAAAAAGLATPQIRAVATIAGNLLQQVRCWYYRHPDLRCLRSGGDRCRAREGDHLYHVCFDRGPCVAPHPSTMATALLAYDGMVELADGRRVTATDLFGDGSDPTRTHTLQAGQFVSQVLLPAPTPGERGAYLRATNRTRAEWPLVEAVVRVTSSANTITTIAVALGGVANIPMRIQEFEEAMRGKPPTPEAMGEAAQLVVQAASPLRQTAYKVELIPGVIAATIERALEQSDAGPQPQPSAGDNHGAL